LYQVLLTNIYTETPIVCDKWTQIFKQDINFTQAFTLSKITSKSTKLQAFQFSLLHQYTPHNYKLCKMKITTSPNCNHCTSVDTLPHRFYECKDVQLFWKQIERLYQEVYNRYITIDLKTVILGTIRDDNIINTRPFNLCILVGKYYIHLTRLKQNTLFSEDFFIY